MRVIEKRGEKKKKRNLFNIYFRYGKVLSVFY